MQNAKISPQEFLQLLEKLLSEKIPTQDLIALGGALASLSLGDWKAIGGNVFMKDIRPIYQDSRKKVISLKELKKSIREEGAKNFLKSAIKTSQEKIKGSFDNAKVSIPEAKNRFSNFTKRIAADYGKLSSNEERGNYILKLSLYSGVFALAFQKGAKQKMLSKSTVPLIALGMGLILINRILEQAEMNLGTSPGGLQLSKELRSLLRTLNSGLTSGMTFNVMVDGLSDQNIKVHDLEGKAIGSLMPKSIIDNMIYSTLMGLFSNTAK